MQDESMIKIAVLPGDGVGAEVTRAAIPVIHALGIPAHLEFGDIGWHYWETEGNAIPDRTWQLIHKADVTLLGAITSKPQREAQQALPPALKEKKLTYVSPILQLRQQLDLFANVRPCFNVKDEKAFKVCVIRENTEGLYAGLDYYPVPEVLHDYICQQKEWRSMARDALSCTLRLQTRSGLKRLFAFAFQYAEKNAMQRVTFADKPNVLRQSSAFARALFEAKAAEYPHIKADILNVDAVALWLIRRPEEFGVIVAENMFGDILSDVGAGVMGGLGFAPSGNIGQTACYFEPVHGSAPRIQANQANPCAMFFTISMMLEHLGYKEEAKRIYQSVKKIITEGRFRTYDQAGRASTNAIANAIIEDCTLEKPKIHKKDRLNQKLQKLSEYSTSVISDALDACGVEGALLGIKPMTMGKKVVGLAYTIQYSPYEKEERQSFKGAADYIDAVSEHSVIVIDNQGRADCTVWGEILTQTALKKNISGTVVYGAVRDFEAIRQSGYPVYANHQYMRSGKNRVYQSSEQSTLMIHNIPVNPNDIIVADENGVLVIPHHLLDDIMMKAQAIAETEHRILHAVREGEPLKQARKTYGYDRPWCSKNPHPTNVGKKPAKDTLT